MIYKTKHEKGQALILIAFAAIGLFAFAALAIDGSRQFSNKRNAQNAADTAALTAALKYIRTGDLAAAKLEAEARVKSNGYVHAPSGAEPTWVLINLCSDQDKDMYTGALLTETVGGVTKPKLVDCPGLPTTGAVRSEYIRVRIVTTIPTTFGRVIGRQTMMSAAEAITRVHGSSTASTSSGFDGAAMVSTKGGNNNNCFLMNGGADLETHDSAISINCSSNQAAFINGGAKLTMDGAGDIVGCYAYNGGASFSPNPPFDCPSPAGVSKVYDENTFASVPTMPNPPSCSEPGHQTATTLSKGYFNSNVTINNDTVMGEGVYCFNAGINVNGHSKLSGPTGRVQLVMGNNDFNLGTTEFVFNNLEVYTVNGSLRTNGNGGLTTIDPDNRLRFYSSGTGNFQVNGNGWLRSEDAYIYLKGGEITWNGNSKIDLHAAKADDPEGIGGLLVHMPWSNQTPIKFNGGSDIHLTGTCLMPHSHVTFNGGVNFELHSQIIGYEYIVNGGGTVDIYYVAEENYNPPTLSDPTIEFTK